MKMRGGPWDGLEWKHHADYFSAAPEPGERLVLSRAWTGDFELMRLQPGALLPEGWGFVYRCGDDGDLHHEWSSADEIQVAALVGVDA